MRGETRGRRRDVRESRARDEIIISSGGVTRRGLLALAPSLPAKITTIVLKMALGAGGRGPSPAIA